MAWSPLNRAKRRRDDLWLPSAAPARQPSAEQERAMDRDDLTQLLAATNAKRAAHGKPPLSADEVELRVWSDQQAMRRSAPPLPE